MKNFFKTFSALLIGVLSIGLVSCSDDDEPGYDEKQPIVGTWIVNDVSNISYNHYYGGMLSSEEEWNRDFIKEWTGKKLTFKANQIKDNIVWVKNSENGTNGREDIYYEVYSANELELIAYYTRITYTSSGNRLDRTSARMVMTRK